jgi:hypothetical protein
MSSNSPQFVHFSICLVALVVRKGLVFRISATSTGRKYCCNRWTFQTPSANMKSDTQGYQHHPCMVIGLQFESHGYICSISYMPYHSLFHLWTQCSLLHLCPYANSVTKYIELSNVRYHSLLFSFFITLPHIRFINNFSPELFPVSQKT